MLTDILSDILADILADIRLSPAGWNPKLSPAGWNPTLSPAGWNQSRMRGPEVGLGAGRRGPEAGVPHCPTSSEPRWLEPHPEHCWLETHIDPCWLEPEQDAEDPKLDSGQDAEDLG